MRFILLSLFVVFVFVAPVAAQKAVADKSEYVGYKYRGALPDETLPNGVKSLGGGLITENEPTYGIGRKSKDGAQMLWLEIMTERDAEGVPSWEVKDVLAFPTFSKNQELLFSYGSTCQRNGKGDVKMIVLADFSNTAKTYKVRRAWLANTKTEKFNEIPVKGVQCFYEEP
jgi:hypothetical protein